MDEILTSTLSDAVYGRLDYVDDLVVAADRESLCALATTEMTRLSETVRAMLIQHEPDSTGHCPQCSGWLRHQRHPCSIWTVAHQRMLGPADAGLDEANPSPTNRARRHRAFRRQQTKFRPHNR
jgi:hypothetical protein